MRSTFLDTSFLLALAIESDELHPRALAWQRHARGSLVTSEFILLEVADALCAPEDRPLTLSILTELEASDEVEIMPANSDWLRRGKQLFTRRADKHWGLTDCISFEMMRDKNMSDALTYDHHFEQAGFHAMLRYDPPGL